MRINNSCSLCCTKLEGFGVTLNGHELLRDVNLHIHCGELTGLIGPNGAGKTTLLRAMLGEIKHSGSLNFLDAKGLHTGRPLIGYVPQNINIDKGSPVTVLDFCRACVSSFPVWLPAKARNRERVKRNLEQVQADHLITRKMGELSGGELQRVMLACALDPVPDLLLLDEPVSGVDPRGLEIFYQMVSNLRNNHDLSIILVSHDLGLMARFADRLVFLNQTVIASGPPAQVLSAPEVINTFGSIWANLAIPEEASCSTCHHSGGCCNA